MTTEDEFDDLKTHDKYSLNDFIGQSNLGSPLFTPMTSQHPHELLVTVGQRSQSNIVQ